MSAPTCRLLGVMLSIGFRILIACVLASGCAGSSPTRLVSSAPTGDIEGRIVNSFEEPVPSVAVRLRGTKHFGLTDSAGHYLLRVSPGAYTVEAEATGFDPQGRRVSVRRGRITKVNLSLDDKTLRSGGGPTNRKSFGDPGSVLPPCSKPTSVNTSEWNSIRWTLHGAPALVIQLPRGFARSRVDNRVMLQACTGEQVVSSRRRG